ncbi:MAG: hypothetical protein KKB30_07510 [Proteobacteria bacterium]|nr:hypothetical protein [Pseudomonadota bacterium]MBU1717115.1 hypothetical protein [Pseudomonadota bacterium]
MSDIRIEYIFTWANGRAVFELELDDETLALKEKPLIGLPAWTKLDYYQCPNCPLHVDQVHYCPAAISLIPVINNFINVDSCDELEVEVSLFGRRIIQKASARRAISSIMGLLFAASGCPHTRFFRPMARYHLPLSNEDETTMRAVSMYMVAQYFKYNSDGKPDLELAGLKAIYEEIQVVNMTMAERLQSRDGTASSINAMILLDMYAKTVPSAIEDTLEDLRYLFNSYIEE